MPVTVLHGLCLGLLATQLWMPLPIQFFWLLLGNCLLTASCAHHSSIATPHAITTFNLNYSLATVDDGYIGFALDRSFVANPPTLPDDEARSVRVDFANPRLRAAAGLVRGGWLRVGGTYTDFVQYYVPGTNHQRCPLPNITRPNRECPGNSYPCCLPMPMERWVELLSFAAEAGLKVAFNLNLVQGRWAVYTEAYRHKYVWLPRWPLRAVLNPPWFFARVQMR